MKAYMNKFKAPGIPKSTVSQPNEIKKEEDSQRKSSSTIESPESSKPTEMADQKAEKVQKKEEVKPEESKAPVVPQQRSLFSKPDPNFSLNDPLMNNIFEQLSKQISQQILQRSEVQHTKEMEEQKDEKQEVKITPHIDMVLDLYEQLPVQPFIQSIQRVFGKQIKKKIMDVLPMIFMNQIDQSLNEEIKKRSLRTQDLAKITHAYLKKHGKLPNIAKLKLDPIKVKFEIDFSLAMNFRKGDFGKLVQSQDVTFKQFE